MKTELKAVIGLFVFCLTILILLLMTIFYIRETSKFPVDWTTGAIERLLSILQLCVGAVVGALSAAFAVHFPSRRDVTNTKDQSH